MFANTTLFNDIPCPAKEMCVLINCAFKHEEVPHKTDADASVEPQPDCASQDIAIEPPAKRRKVVYKTLQDKPCSKAERIQSELAQLKTRKEAGVRNDDTTVTTSTTINNDIHSPKHSSLERPISPPVKIPEDKDSTSVKEVSRVPEILAQFKKGKTETLNPRVVTPAPDSHSKRTVFLQHIHSDMARLNRNIKSSNLPVDGVDPIQLKSFVLDNQALIKFALTEEENIAKDKPAVYGNIIRNRIAAYKRMTLDDWLRKLKTTVFSLEGLEPTPKQQSLKLAAAVVAFDKLDADEMSAYFERFKIKDLQTYSKHGYVFEPPTEAQAAAAKDGVEASGLHEQCDRCGSYFRIIPDRDPGTGRLTSNGPCHFHWARRVFATRQRTDAYTGGREGIYRCCGQEAGATGCTTYPDHVFKCSAPSRLAAVLPFIKTPANKHPRKAPDGTEVKGVVFDCEMGYTTNGLELIRLTALRWPTKEPLLDVLVRPLGAVIDLNTRFSGVKPEHFANALPYDKSEPSKALSVVADPTVARSLLCDFLDGDRVPLMGHALENDLNATRLCHAFLIDTVTLYSHPRGLPMRYGLKMLTKKHLDRDIQMGGSEGHDSFEDAAATLDLILNKGMATEKNSSWKNPLPLKRRLSSPDEQLVKPLLTPYVKEVRPVCEPR